MVVVTVVDRTLPVPVLRRRPWSDIRPYQDYQPLVEEEEEEEEEVEEEEEEEEEASTGTGMGKR